MKKVPLLAWIWVAVSLVVIVGVIVTKEIGCLLFLALPTVIQITQSINE